MNAKEYIKFQLREYPNHEEYNEETLEAISSFMEEYAKYYYEQYESVHLADVVNCAPDEKAHYASLLECANKILDKVEAGEVPRKDIMGLKILMGR